MIELAQRIYMQGLDDAWELAGKLAGLDADERKHLFDHSSVKKIFRNMSYLDVYDLYEAFGQGGLSENDKSR